MYTTIKCIGHGGFGVVYLIQYEDGMEAAKKIFQPMDSNLDQILLENVKKRFIREVKVQSSIKHSNIMPVLRSELLQDPPSYIMPLAQTSLDKERTNICDIPSIMKVLLDILAGLEELHSLDIQHRDLKPQNILLLNDRYVISDFGLVSIKETQISALTQTGMRMGSDFYTAPEIVEELRNASNMSDIFSFGCILHDFFGVKSRIPCQTIYDEKSIVSDIIEICTRQNPQQRFQNIKDLRESLVDSLSLATSISTISHEGIDYRNYLKDQTNYEDSMLIKFFNYLESSKEKNDVNYIYNSISNEIIDKILYLPNRAKNFANLYSIWSRTTLHDFNKCDVIAGHLEKLYISIEDLGVRSNILLALLIMGAGHNRWYVEEKFAKYVQQADFNLCRRFIMEAKVIGDDVKGSFAHLEYSIGPQKGSLPELLQNYFTRSQ